MVAAVGPVARCLVGAPGHVALVLGAEARGHGRRGLAAVVRGEAGLEAEAAADLALVPAAEDVAAAAEVVAGAVVALGEVVGGRAGGGGQVVAEGAAAVLDAVWDPAEVWVAWKFVRG